ncbi:tetratricopeptide repeat protein [Aquabacterium sp.]|uniref:tetratricopeptide repeat protein n=1 Tax=Aquabacterium sp. TaxID=1872578 RepID=UPI002E2F9B1F|nr:tetratricopeptide repeat protein [Aquabacterium sp.]HEX5311433.1 tetratricopeptide repeat protein [Aquabacterium sp.]
MIDITLENFESDLIKDSIQQPILLDIWAEWCGPCKSLGPVLEKLEVEYAGRFKLAKVNADTQPEIAGQLSQMFGVRSIPFCVMFVGGQPVDGFVGALPEAKIREFLAKHVPSEGEIASEEETLEAEEAAAAGDTETAVSKLLEALERDPANDEARFDLIKLLLQHGQVVGAKEIFEPVAARASGPIPEPRVAAFGRYIDSVLGALGARPVDELQAAIAANKRDFDARLELAQTLIAAGEFTLAMDELLEIIMRDKKWNDEAARKTYVALLEVMSKPPVKPSPAAAGAADGKPKLEIAGKHEVISNDPVIDQYRRKLSMALF